MINVFPNLQDLHLLLEQRAELHILSRQQDDSLSTSTAVRFLHYLVNVSTFDVPIIYVENVTNIFTEFYDNFHTLSITFSHRSSPNSRTALKISSKDLANDTKKPVVAEGGKGRLHLEVEYSSG